MLYYLIISIYRHYLIQQGGGGFAAPAALLSDLCFSTASCRSCGRRPAERRCRSIRRLPRLGRCSPTGFFIMILQLFCPLCNAPRPFWCSIFCRRSAFCSACTDFPSSSPETRSLYIILIYSLQL